MTSLKLETARIPIVLTGREWAALCIEFMLNKNPAESAAIRDLAKLKILQEVYRVAKALCLAIVVGSLVATVALADGNGNGNGNGRPPSNSNGGLVTHNGSLMRVDVRPDGLVLIRYVDPKPAMREFVVPGTVLIEGRWVNHHFSGVSHSYWCGRAYPYAVTGAVGPDGVLVLQGPAPIIDPYSCGVLGYAWTDNSTLVFAPYGQPPGPPGPPPPEVPPPPNGFPPPPVVFFNGFRNGFCRIGPQIFRGLNYLGPPPGCF